MGARTGESERTRGRRAALGLLAALLAVPAAHAARVAQPENLIAVVTPSPDATAPAHPFVNVRVVFGSAGGVAADPATFRARLGRRDVTSRFAPLVAPGPGEPGTVTMVAQLEPPLVRVGGRNRLRVVVQTPRTRRGRKGRPLRDKDQVRFRAVPAENAPPVARALADSLTVLESLPVQLDATQSQDPEMDPLTYAWDFGDGTAATDARPAHVFAGGGTEITVQLTVSDGQAFATAPVVLLGRPVVDAGRTPGLVRVEADAALEFGAVALGDRATRALAVGNADLLITSQLKVLLITDDPAFSLTPATLDLAAGESAPVTLAFAPTTPGHHTARLRMAVSAADRSALSFLAHGYGGAAPGTGPTLAAAPVFHTRPAEPFGVATHGILPSGAPFLADNGVHVCAVPEDGLGAGDVCLVDADCSHARGGDCPATSSCAGGARAGQSCARPADCPAGLCPSWETLDPVGLCGDGAGGFFVLSDDGTFTEPNDDADDERAVTLMRLSLDANGTVTQAKILDRPTTGTLTLACDGLAASAGGRLYLAEVRNVDDDDCFRIEREALVALRKSTGSRTTILSTIDTATGLDACDDDLDPVYALRVTRDGSEVFATFGDGDVWRLRPSPLPFLTGIQEPELLALHPDGSVLYATATDTGTTGLVTLYKVRRVRVATGALPLAGLAPCATFAVPNNGGRTVVVSLAADRAASGAAEGVVLVGFGAASTTRPDPAFTPSLRPRGTVAFTSPSGADACTTVGLVTAEALEQLAF